MAQTATYIVGVVIDEVSTIHYGTFPSFDDAAAWGDLNARQKHPNLETWFVTTLVAPH